MTGLEMLDGAERLYERADEVRDAVADLRVALALGDTEAVGESLPRAAEAVAAFKKSLEKLEEGLWEVIHLCREQADDDAVYEEVYEEAAALANIALTDPWAVEEALARAERRSEDVGRRGEVTQALRVFEPDDTGSEEDDEDDEDESWLDDLFDDDEDEEEP